MSELINDCKSAALHLIGKTQAYGVLLALDRNSGKISACSENTKEFLAQDVKDIIGQNWTDLFKPGDISFESVVDDSDMNLPTISESVLNNKPVIISSHPRREFVIVEIEPHTDEALYDHRDRLDFLQNLSMTNTPDDAACLLLQHIANVTNYDRVLLYKFLPDWHGKVIAEHNKPGVQGFLGLHFPAGDIPENARQLYTVNTQRIIVDVTAADVNIIAADENTILDLTYAQLRAVHPVHVQYLQNLGVRTSYSVSIVVSKKLWGMIACHHLQPSPIGFRRRLLCEELARTVSLHMSGLVALEAEQRRSKYFAVKSAIQAALKSSVSLSDTFNLYAAHLSATFAADGIWLNVDGNDLRYGVVSEIEDLAVLRNWLDQLDKQQMFHANKLAQELEPYPSLLKHASGILFMPLGQRGFVLFCRNEQAENVQWAGRSHSSATVDGQIDEFTPRRSFEMWSEQVLGKSLSWHEIELESADRLRNVLLGHLEKTKLAQMAMQDGLTGLPNRVYFVQELDKAITLSKAKGTIVAVFMLDLDKFKPINDNWGHSAGDDLLIQVADRLKELVRGRDVVARFGGDEFAVILYNFDHFSEVESVASRVIEQLQRPFRLKDTEVQIGASLGIALYPEHAKQPQELIEKADAALYEVKRSGRNAWRTYDPDPPALRDKTR